MKVRPKEISSSLYHSTLRVSLVVMALTLVFVSGILDSSTQTLSLITKGQLANVVDVTSTEITNSQTSVQEVGTMVGSDAQAQSKTTFFVATVLFILLLLTILNYILYYLRHREVAVTLVDFRI